MSRKVKRKRLVTEKHDFEKDADLHQMGFQLFQQQHSEDTAVLPQPLKLCWNPLKPQALQASARGLFQDAAVVPHQDVALHFLNG